MNATAPSPPVTLARDSLRRFTGPVRVQCDSGTLWITVDGEPDDLILQPGEARCFARGARVIVYAIGAPATLRARPAAAPRGAWPARAWRGLRRLLGPAPAGARA